MMRIAGEMVRSAKKLAAHREMARRPNICPVAVPNDRLVSELTQIETFYGCLVYLAGLRNPDNGRYEHYAASTNSNNLVANETLRQIHEQIFKEWVSLPLERKKSDIERYINGIDQVDRSELIDAWLRLTPYKNLVPGAIQGPERQKHISDFEAILGLLRNVYGVAAPDPNA
jgi:hypothetical protein